MRTVMSFTITMLLVILLAQLLFALLFIAVSDAHAQTPTPTPTPVGTRICIPFTSLCVTPGDLMGIAQALQDALDNATGEH